MPIIVNASNANLIVDLVDNYDGIGFVYENCVLDKILNGSLKRIDLLNYEPYGKITLTKAGIEYAKKILEAYDIVYLFLKEVLNVDDDKAENEAEKMKAALSFETINSLAKYLHQMLEIKPKNCCYNLSSSKCRKCLNIDVKKNKILNLKKGN